MKAFYIPVGLLAVILGFSLWSGRYVELRTQHWNTLLEEIDGLAGQEAWEQAGQKLEEAYADWNGSQTFFHTIMDHNELDEAEELFAGFPYGERIIQVLRDKFADRLKRRVNTAIVLYDFDLGYHFTGRPLSVMRERKTDSFHIFSGESVYPYR